MCKSYIFWGNSGKRDHQEICLIDSGVFVDIRERGGFLLPLLLVKGVTGNHASGYFVRWFGDATRKYQQKNPKILLEVSGHTVLDWQLNLLKEIDITETILASGHLHNLLYEHVGVYRDSMPDSIFKTRSFDES